MEWINVKEKMPKVGQKVLCATVHIENNKLLRDYFVCRYNKSAFFDDMTGEEVFKFFDIPDTDAVTHWCAFEEIAID